MDLFSTVMWGFFLSSSKAIIKEFVRRFSRWGFELHEDKFVDYTPYRPDLRLWDYETSMIKNIEIQWYPLVTRTREIWWCELPRIFTYDSEMIYLLGIVFYDSDTTGLQIFSYCAILLAWCVEGSHGLCTKEAFDTLVIASRLVFGKPAVHYFLRWSHQYLMTTYGTDYQNIEPLFEEDKMAYLAYEFIKMLETPYLD